MDGWDGNLCVGLFYEHRFAVLINDSKIRDISCVLVSNFKRKMAPVSRNNKDVRHIMQNWTILNR